MKLLFVVLFLINEAGGLGPSTTLASTADTTTTSESTSVPITTTVDFTSQSGDPCDSYNFLNDYWRSNSNYYYYYYSGSCDYNIYWSGWYRLLHYGQDGQMPESCVSSGSCGTSQPMWLNGRHPQPEDGVVTRQVCASNWNGCCGYSYSIQVKACPGNYYVYELVSPISCSAYCTEVRDPNPTTSVPPTTTVSFSSLNADPCDSFTSLYDSWRSTSNFNHNHYNYGSCDYNMNWRGWYRLFHYGQDAQMPESCVNSGSCGTSQPMWLNGRHPQPEEGVVTRQVCASNWNGCCGYSYSIRVKACPGNYYVYEPVSPTSCSAYCTEVRDPNPTTYVPPTTTVSSSTLNFDPCDRYSSLSDYWRSTSNSNYYNYYYYNYYNSGSCDYNIYWNGWYRLFHYGQDGQMPESCVSSGSCGTSQPMWLNGRHPQPEDGVVTRQVCASNWNGCCGYSYSIQVKACPGNYYVYELVSPISCSAYCTEVRDPNPTTSVPPTTTVSFSSLNADPCDSFTSLYDSWRSTSNFNHNHYNYGSCDYNMNWRGWYRLLHYGQDAQMPESCVSSGSCGTSQPMWLNGRHPQPEEGVVTRQVCASNWNGCCGYSYSIRVKACPGNYYVYEPVSPTSCSAYCTEVRDPNPTTYVPPTTTVSSSTLNFDPCDRYSSLSDYWRSTSNSNNYNYYYYNYYNSGSCDYNIYWNGWYRLFHYGEDAQMPESCVNSGSCGTSQPMWLNGRHPQPEEGVVIRQVCASNWYGCCGYSYSIRVKACPGNYYVYEPVSPISCSAYCTEVRPLTTSSTPTIDSTTITETTTSVFNTTVDPCAEVNCTHEEWCGEKDGTYGCFCNFPRSNPDTYDYSEICESSSGFFSLSRCQLFEDGFPAEILHLRDVNCKGTVRNGRVEFHFDNKDLCGTNLVANGTHFIYENVILAEGKSSQLISRKSHLMLPFTCIYSQSQTFSMNTQINPLESYLHKTVSAGQGTYRVRMVPYLDPYFSQPINGSVNVNIDQPVYVEVNVDGIDAQQFALVIDTCWATPVNDPLYHVRWDLIVGECPSLQDGTVDLMQNGFSTSSRFSFRMFTFTEESETFFLHCSIHLCLLRDNNCFVHCGFGYRRRRAVDFYDNSSISLGPIMRPVKTTGMRMNDQVEVSRASALCGSLIPMFLFGLSIYNRF